MNKLAVHLTIIVLFAAMSQGTLARAGSHRAVFILNMATFPDTLPVTGTTIHMRISTNEWIADSSGLMTLIGGDYWSRQMDLDSGTVVHYRYSVEYPGVVCLEQSTNSADGFDDGNRSFVMGNRDTTLQVEFWNSGPQQAQYWRPYPDHGPDTMMVYFRVNMGGPIRSGLLDFNNDIDTVSIRGGGPAGSDLSWTPSAYYLKRETTPSGGSGYTSPANWFWSAGLRVVKSGITEGEVIQYKFLIGYDWGRAEFLGGGLRQFTVPAGKKDTTLQWVFFDNMRPVPAEDTVFLTWSVDMQKAIASGGFVPGDTLYVRSGYYGTGAVNGHRVKLENTHGTLYEAPDTVVRGIGKILDYQYIHLTNGMEVRENYYNYYYSGSPYGEAGLRQFTIPAKRFTLSDTATGVAKPRRMPDFTNLRPLAHSVMVKYEVNLKPVYYQLLAGDTLVDNQGTYNVTMNDIAAIAGWGVYINGPAVGGWSNPGGNYWGSDLQSNLSKRLWDDGTHGDAVAGDTIYTITVQCGPDSLLAGTKGWTGQVFKFGVRGGDNESGNGVYPYNGHANIVDTGSTFTIHCQFGEINPPFYNAWDFDHERPKDLTSQIVYNQGWNMVSVPVTILNGSPQDLFPSATSKLFSFNGKYTLQDTASVGSGYWVKFGSTTAISYSGQVRNIVHVPVTTGWNLIGSVSGKIPVSEIFSKPPGMVTSRIFGYFGNYVQVAELEPGWSYWVKVASDGELVLNFSHPVPMAAIRMIDGNEMPPLPPGDQEASVSGRPGVYALSQNYPNPFNPTTTIHFELPHASHVKLQLFNVLGEAIRTLADDFRQSGSYDVTVDGTGLASGVYYYRIITEHFAQTRKMLLVR